MPKTRIPMKNGKAEGEAKDEWDAEGRGVNTGRICGILVLVGVSASTGDDAGDSSRANCIFSYFCALPIATILESAQFLILVDV